MSFNASITDTNLVTLTWETTGGQVGEPVHIYGAYHRPDTGNYFHNVGYQANQTNTTGISFRVQPGTHRYVLELPVSATEKVHATQEITIDPPAAVELISPIDSIYPSQISSVSVSWQPLGSNEHLEIRVPGQSMPILVTTGNNYTFSQQFLTDELGPGRHKIAYFACRDTQTATHAINSRFCSAPARADIVIGSARFLGPDRIYAQTGDSVTVSWTPLGDTSELRVPDSLGGPSTISVSGQTHTFPNVTEGNHTIKLDTCITTPSDCANTEPVIAPVAGIFLPSNNFALYIAAAVVEGVTVVAHIDTGAGLVPILASASGRLVADLYSIPPGTRREHRR